MRILERAPHFLSNVRELLQIVLAVFGEFVVHESLGILTFTISVVLVAAVADDVRQDAEERQFFIVAGETLVFRVVQLTCAIIIKNVTENVRVAIEKIFFDLFIVEKLAFI